MAQQGTGSETRSAGSGATRGWPRSKWPGGLGISPSYLNLIEHNQRPADPASAAQARPRSSTSICSSFSDNERRAAACAELTELLGEPLFREHDIGQRGSETSWWRPLSPALCHALLGAVPRLPQRARGRPQALGRTAVSDDGLSGDIDARAAPRCWRRSARSRKSSTTMPTSTTLSRQQIHKYPGHRKREGDSPHRRSTACWLLEAEEGTSSRRRTGRSRQRHAGDQRLPARLSDNHFPGPRGRRPAASGATTAWRRRACPLQIPALLIANCTASALRGGWPAPSFR